MNDEIKQIHIDSPHIGTGKLKKQLFTSHTYTLLTVAMLHNAISATQVSF